MRSMFSSNFKNVRGSDVNQNCQMIDKGQELYRNYISTAQAVRTIDNYQSIPAIHATTGISPYAPISKRAFYSGYTSGVIVGAGSGEDCIDLNNMSFRLFDLTDLRYENKAIGHSEGATKFTLVGSTDGDTLAPVKDEYVKATQDIEVITIDSLALSECDLIAADAEGTGIDVLAGAHETMLQYHPTVLLSIYHNWQEYLLSVPMLYDLGYSIEAVQLNNAIPHNPQLELALLATHKGKIDEH